MIVVSEINLNDPFPQTSVIIPICQYCGSHLKFDENRNVICDCPLFQLHIKIEVK
jgi:hypothetical protein